MVVAHRHCHQQMGMSIGPLIGNSRAIPAELPYSSRSGCAHYGWIDAMLWMADAAVCCARPALYRECARVYWYIYTSGQICQGQRADAVYMRLISTLRKLTLSLSFYSRKKIRNNDSMKR